MTPGNNPFARAAARYAEIGWPVFPVIPRDKQPLTSKGFLDATTDPAQVAEWAAQWPDANIGFCPGKAGLVVFDLDGEDAKKVALGMGLYAEPTMTAITARGEHLYFQHPGGEVRNQKIAGGIDVRGDMGYVLLPPSIHTTGAVYKWAAKGQAAAALPPKAKMTLEYREAKQTAAPLPEAIIEGGRNSLLASLAGSARRRGASEGAILAMLREENLSRCSPPLEESEVEGIAKSIGRYPPETPKVEVHETALARNTVILGDALKSLESTQVASSWGWRDFDQQFGPLVQGWLYLIGARPSNGKTTLLLNVLSRLWEDNVPTFYFGTEMSPADPVKKWAAMRCGYDELEVFENKMTPGQRQALSLEIEALMVRDTVTFSKVTRLDVRRMAEEIAWAFDKRTGPEPKVVILDHIHRVTQDREELEVLARELKTLATERNVAMVVAAQLNREQGIRAFDLYHPPAMSRFKGSAALEENADVALGLFRPLRRGVRKADRIAVENGEAVVGQFAEENALAAICAKHRYRGSIAGNVVLLTITGSRLESRAFGSTEPKIAESYP